MALCKQLASIFHCPPRTFVQMVVLTWENSPVVTFGPAWNLSVAVKDWCFPLSDTHLVKYNMSLRGFIWPPDWEASGWNVMVYSVQGPAPNKNTIQQL